MMTKNIKQIVFWMPLVLGVLLAGFLSIIALHSEGQGHGLQETLWSILLQVLPSILLALEIALALRRKWFGAAFFLASAGWSFLAASLPDTVRHVLVLLGF